MRCFNTPLPFSFSPTPPHTWDGHFISEYSKWKGDLNLPCLPVTPFLSPSPTHSFRCWWTERCWLPIADTRVSYLEKHFFFQVLSSVVSLFCFMEYFLVCDWQHLEKPLRKYFSLFSVLCSVRSISSSLFGLSRCCQCFNHCSHKSSYAMTIDFLWIAGANQFIRKVNRNHWINWTLATLGKIAVFSPNILVMRNWNELLVFIYLCITNRGVLVQRCKGQGSFCWLAEKNIFPPKMGKKTKWWSSWEAQTSPSVS